MPRFFFVNKQLNESSCIKLSGDELHHLWVMRLRPGDFIYIINGSGHRYKAKILEMTRIQALLKIVCEETLKQSPRPKISLGQAIPRFNKIELILQKATELGVDYIYPLQTERSFLKKGKSLSQNRWQRWEKIITEAAKQSGRADVPSLLIPQAMESFLKEGSESSLKICLWEESDSKQSLKEFLGRLNKPDSVSILIGPEGSFSQKEIESVKASGYHIVTCGHRIMRVETAALTCMAICQYEWGDL